MKTKFIDNSSDAYLLRHLLMDKKEILVQKDGFRVFIDNPTGRIDVTAEVGRVILWKVLEGNRYKVTLYTDTCGKYMKETLSEFLYGKKNVVKMKFLD
jgi:hypothetical protein